MRVWSNWVSITSTRTVLMPAQRRQRAHLAGAAPLPGQPRPEQGRRAARRRGCLDSPATRRIKGRHRGEPLQLGRQGRLRQPAHPQGRSNARPRSIATVRPSADGHDHRPRGRADRGIGSAASCPTISNRGSATRSSRPERRQPGRALVCRSRAERASFPSVSLGSHSARQSRGGQRDRAPAPPIWDQRPADRAGGRCRWRPTPADPRHRRWNTRGEPAVADITCLTRSRLLDAPRLFSVNPW